MGLPHSSTVRQPVRLNVATASFRPFATVKCVGPRAFRTQRARDVACLLDVDPDVSSWTCLPKSLDLPGGRYVADFAASASDGRVTLVDAGDGDLPHPSEAEASARTHGLCYRRYETEEVYGGFRLANAKDLLRYGNYRAALGDRVRLLAALDEAGTLTVAECMMAMQEGNPMGALASLILREFVVIDLDDALIGPETVVRRIAR